MKIAVLLLLACTGVLTRVQALTWRNINNVDALCNDFTRAGYYIRTNDSSSDWVVFLESGGACYSATTCNRRYFTRETRERYGGGVITQEFNLTRAWNENRDNPRDTVSPLMTSIKNLTGNYDNIEGTDILSTDRETNQDFYHYNHILVPYCSSDLWLGDDDRFGNKTDFEFDPSNNKTIQFIFRGFTIFRSVIHEAINNTQGRVLLAGSSAGGIGVLNHAKWVKERLPNANIRVFAESSWFVNFHDNIYNIFTDYVNISKDSRGANFNITEYVLEQEQENMTSLFSLILHHPPCNSIELGTPCCISAHCLVANSEYYPSDIPTFMAHSLYDVYILAQSLKGVEPYNAQENSFEFHFDQDETEPVGLNFNFLRIIGEYGGVMNSTLDVASHQSPHLSFYVTSCLQHIYLATSSLWGEDGDDEALFGSDSFEFSNDVSSIRHTVEKGRWSQFKLTPSLERPDKVSIRDAIRIWLNTANSTNPVQFRDGCYLTHCNEMCPEEITLEQDDSFLWKYGFEVFIYCFVATVTLICFIIKGVFYFWHWWLLHKQKEFLQRARDSEKLNATYQFPECQDKISIACMDLRYSVPFNHKKHKEASAYDVKPLVLPTINTDECDGDEENSTEFNEENEGAASGPDNVDGVANGHLLQPASASYNQLDSKESENSGMLNSASPLLSTKDPFVFPEVSDAGLKRQDIKKKTLKPMQKVKNILKGISLYFNPGQLVAIMGPSGSGKTTFLDLLTGRRKSGNITGSIYINGHRLDDIRDWYIANTGYVLQLASPYYEELTVRENLTLAAQMRLPLSMREKFERIEQVMNGTGLQELADIVVGGTVGPGLSGGQKKRLTIALQLLRLPSVIFLDEPTSGLDSASSYELLSYLNKLAGSQRTVIMTIHQPRMEIFHMFTRLIMLCEGKVAYHGSPFKAYEVFITALKAQLFEKGLVLPQLEDQNPADVIMDMLGNSKMREAILQYYEESGDPKYVVEAIKLSQEKEEETTDGGNDGFIYMLFGKKRVLENQGSGFTRMATLEARAALRTTIPQLAYLPVIFLGYGFLLGTVYIQTTSAVLIVSGFCVYSVASALFMFPIMHKYYSQALTLYQLEHSDGIGHSVDLVIQGFARFVFLGLIPVILCGGILYLLVIMVSSYSLEVYLKVLVVNMALNQTWIALLMFILCAFPSVAFRLSPVISSVAGFTSGFFIPRESMPPWYRWLFFINPNYYGFSSTAYLLLKEFDSNCAGNELECYVSTGEYTLTQFNFNETNPALHVMILLIMTVGYLLLAVIAMWIRHADFGPAFRRVKSMFFSPKGKISDYEQYSRSHSPAGMDPFDSDNERHGYDIQMTAIGEEALSDSDEFLSDIEGDEDIFFENPHDIESQINQTPLDTVVQGASNNPNKSNSGSINSNKKQNRSSLATVEEMSEEPLPTYSYVTSNMDLNESHAQLERMLDPSSPPPSYEKRNGNQEGVQKQTSSSSLPETGDASKVKPFVKGRSSIEMFRSAATASKPEHKMKRRSTKHDFSSGSQRPRELHLQRRTSRFHSKFLNDNEFHVIWKPDTPNVTTASEPIQKKPSTSTMLPATDPGMPKSTSWDQQDGNVTSPGSGLASPTGAPGDLWLRQKQLQERVNIAREVSKDQNLKLVQSEISQDEKRRTLQLASRYVSYRISKKPRRLDDVVLHAMGSAADSSKQSLLEDSDEPLSPKQKWQKAVLLTANKRQQDMKRPSMTSIASSHSEIQPISIRTIGQRMNKMNKKPLIGSVSQSQSDYNLSALSKCSPPNKRSTLKSRTTYTMMNTRAQLEDVAEVENELEKQISVKNKSKQQADIEEGTARLSTKSVKNEDSTDALEAATASFAAVDKPLLVPSSGNTLNNDNYNNGNDEATTEVTDEDEFALSGHGWSGSLHGYDNPVSKFNQLYLPGSNSSMSASSTTSYPEMEPTETLPGIKFTRSNSTEELRSAIQDGLSQVNLRQSRSSGNLSRPVTESFERAVVVPVDYQFRSNSNAGDVSPNALHHIRPKSAVSSCSSLESIPSGHNSPQMRPKKSTHHSKKSTGHTSPRNSAHLTSPSPLIVSASSVLPQVVSPPPSDDNSRTNLIPHMSGEVTSLFAGQQEHRHNEKNPPSSVFQ